MRSTTCPHANFLASVTVIRLTDHDDGPVTGYTTRIRIHCADCGLPFRFLGAVPGAHPAAPRVSADGQELRAPLEPAYVTEILGVPLQSGTA